MNLKQISNLLANTGNELIPCTLAEVTELEKKFQVVLPHEYKEFLLIMGKGAGEYMLGSSCFYEDLFNLHEWAREIMAENDLPELPSKAFVFWMHQGYMFTYFIANGDPNPKVYFYTEGKEMNDFVLKCDSLIDFYNQQLDVSGIKH